MSTQSAYKLTTLLLKSDWKQDNFSSMKLSKRCSKITNPCIKNINVCIGQVEYTQHRCRHCISCMTSFSISQLPGTAHPHGPGLPIPWKLSTELSVKIINKVCETRLLPALMRQEEDLFQDSPTEVWRSWVRNATGWTADTQTTSMTSANKTICVFQADFSFYLDQQLLPASLSSPSGTKKWKPLQLPH